MVDNNKKVLIVAYLFPPIGGGGVQRALKMAKYLVEYGWEPHVLTVGNTRHATIDESLLEQIPDAVHIHRADEIFNISRAANVLSQNQRVPSENKVEGKRTYRLKELSREFVKFGKESVLIPDNQILWYPNAVKLGMEVIASYEIDAILSTSGPYTNHLVGQALKRKTSLPWIADFRDPWTQNMHRPSIRWRLKLEELLEEKVMRNCDLLLTVTKSFAKGFNLKYPFTSNKTEVVYNGFDLQDIEKANLQYSEKDTFNLFYAGIFYQKRNPRLLLRAIKELIDEDMIDRKKIRITFAGVFDYPGQYENIDEVKKLGIEDLVHLEGNLPHKEVLGRMKAADVLLLINDVSSDAGMYIPGKLFEYIAVGTPILALSLPGESTDIIEDLNIGLIADPTSLREIKQSAYQLYLKWQNGKSGEVENRDLSKLKLYNRRFQAEQLSRLLFNLVDKQL